MSTVDDSRREAGHLLHHSWKVPDGEGAIVSPAEIPTQILEGLSTNIRVRQLLLVQKDCDEGHVYMIRTHRNCR